MRRINKRLRASAGIAGILLGVSGCTAVKPPPVVVQKPPSPAAPASLMGANTGDLTALLGRPKLRRIDGHAQVWLYDSRVCRLDLILYPGSTGRPVVALASPSPPGVPPASCLASLESRAPS